MNKIIKNKINDLNNKIESYYPEIKAEQSFLDNAIAGYSKNNSIENLKWIKNKIKKLGHLHNKINILKGQVKLLNNLLE